jgi:hypothetical protein
VAVDQFRVVCRSAPRICRMRRQIRYVAWHMEDARAAKNDGRLLFHRAAEGKRGEEALLAVGDAYIDEMLTGPVRLPGQMHDTSQAAILRSARSFASATATSSPTPSRSPGPLPERISSFLATGMLLSVPALMQVQDGAAKFAPTRSGSGAEASTGPTAAFPVASPPSAPGACLRTPRRWPVRRWRISEPV